MVEWLDRRKYKTEFQTALSMIWSSTNGLADKSATQALIERVIGDPNLPNHLEELRDNDVNATEAAIAFAQGQFRMLYCGPDSILSDEQREQIRDILLKQEPPPPEERPDERPFFLFMLEHALYTMSNWMVHGKVETGFFKSFLDTAIETLCNSAEEQEVIQSYLLNGTYAYRDWVQAAPRRRRIL